MFEASHFADEYLILNTVFLMIFQFRTHKVHTNWGIGTGKTTSCGTSLFMGKPFIEHVLWNHFPSLSWFRGITPFRCHLSPLGLSRFVYRHYRGNEGGPVIGESYWITTCLRMDIHYYQINFHRSLPSVRGILCSSLNDLSQITSLSTDLSLFPPFKVVPISQDRHVDFG